MNSEDLIFGKIKNIFVGKITLNNAIEDQRYLWHEIAEFNKNKNPKDSTTKKQENEINSKSISTLERLILLKEILVKAWYSWEFDLYEDIGMVFNAFKSRIFY